MSKEISTNIYTHRILLKSGREIGVTEKTYNEISVPFLQNEFGRGVQMGGFSFRIGDIKEMESYEDIKKRKRNTVGAGKEYIAPKEVKPIEYTSKESELIQKYKREHDYIKYLHKTYPKPSVGFRVGDRMTDEGFQKAKDNAKIEEDKLIIEWEKKMKEGAKKYPNIWVNKHYWFLKENGHWDDESYFDKLDREKREKEKEKEKVTVDKAESMFNEII